jgi:lipopolysaccharide heptosyltransferase II
MVLDRSRIKRILVIKLRAIGDVVLSTAVLSNLRAAFPEAHIDFLTETPSKEVIEGNPFLDSFVIFDNKRQNGLQLILSIRRRRYDLVIDLFGNPRSALVTLFSGAPYRVGFRFKWRKYCYTTVVEPRGGEMHNTEFNLDALRAIGIPINERSITFPVTREAEEFAEQFFIRSGIREKFVVALNPGGGWYTKRWRLSGYAGLGDALVRQYNATILIVWGPGEERMAQEIQSLMKSPALLIPPTSLKELGAILKRCTAVVTNDSGPMHIAAAVGAPVVAIFGPTNPELQGPVGDRHAVVQHPQLLCLGCNFTRCPIGNPCMEELTVETVLSTFQQLIEHHSLMISHEQENS